MKDGDHLVKGVGRLCYEEFGSGPLLLLLQLHGVGFEGYLERVTIPLGASFRCVNLHLPGYGGSDPPKRSAGMVDAADDVAAFLRSFAAGPVLLHGTSLGGIVAITLAGRHPDLVERLVVTSSLPRSDQASLERRRLWRKVLETGDPALYADVIAETAFGRKCFERPDAQKLLAARREAYASAGGNIAAWADGLGSLQATDAMEYAEAIEAPVLCICGSEDTMTPAVPAGTGAGLKEFSERVANGRFKLIDGAGHSICFEQPDASRR